MPLYDGRTVIEPEWWNWQTRQVEGLVTLTGRAGSSPVSGTKAVKGLRQRDVNPFFVWTRQWGHFGVRIALTLRMRRWSVPARLGEDSMAFLERRGKWFRVVFRHGGRRYSQTLRTADEGIARGLLGGIQKTLMLLNQKMLKLPDGVDVLAFVVGNGQVAPASTKSAEEPNVAPLADITLKELKDRYLQAHSAGAMEANSLDTVALHLRHFVRTFGVNFALRALTLGKLQEHVNRRAKRKGIRNRPLSPITIRKEVASLRAAWNWAVQMGYVNGNFPNRGLKYPKTEEKPPFQTWAEIERQINRGVTPAQERDLWDCLFLTLPEIAELIAYVKVAGRHPFIYPMFCFAAHSGARRSEILRVCIGDVDLEAGMLTIHERKRTKGKRTTRRVALTPFLADVLKDWLAVHPGGPYVFCHDLQVMHSKKKRAEHGALTRDEAGDHFKRTLIGSRWEKLRGWHVFRHSFASNCAAKGIDQRIIDEWTGHTSEEMRRRYRHLIPHQQQAAIRLVFSDGQP
jgi:integrase